MSTTLVLYPPSPEIFRQYVEVAAAHEYPQPTGSLDGILAIGTGDGVLVAAVTIFKTTGPYIMFEDFVLNPKVEPRVRHAASEKLAEAIMATCAEQGKVAYCPVQSKGAEMILERYGFEGRDAVIMTRQPKGVVIAHVEPVVKAPPPAPKPPQPAQKKAARKPSASKNGKATRRRGKSPDGMVRF